MAVDIKERNHKLISAVEQISIETNTSFATNVMGGNGNSLDEYGIMSLRNDDFKLYGYQYDVHFTFRDDGKAHGALFCLSFGETYSGKRVTEAIRKIESIIGMEIYDGDVMDGDVVSLSFTEFANEGIEPHDFIHRMYQLIMRDDIKHYILKVLKLSNVDY